jgi:L,D-peptidoglycan transpeptidase YkuD (ErfK/YbiS/YcfS/YnhG family)
MDAVAEPRGTPAKHMTLRARQFGRVFAVLASVVVMAVALGSAGAAGAAQAAARGRAVAVQQLITVQAPSYLATYATLRAYRVVGTQRTLVFGPWRARVGYNGVARPGRKHEGDGKTPSGTYGFSFYFGVQPRLGFAFPFRHAFVYDVWDDDPSSPLYNEWVDKRRHDPGRDPEPMHQVPAYDYAAVIAYNTARVPGQGSAIFLHVGTGSATAGCVSLPRPELIRVLRWMRPAADPQITISAR